MNDSQINKIFAKTQQMELTYEPLIFRTIGEIPVVLMETKEHFRKTPEGDYRPIYKGEIWGGESCTGWFKGEIDGPAGKKLYLSAETGAIETLLFAEDLPKGVFANKVVIHNRGNHHIQLLTDGLEEGQRLGFSLEAYCWHNVPGNQPFSVPETGDRKACFSGVFLCEMEETVKDFVFDLRTLNQLAETLPDDFRRAEVENCLVEVYRLVPQKPEEYPWESVLQSLETARQRMAPALAAQNLGSAPFAALIGHSHLDTAWQWTIDETVRKAARTFSNAVSLLEQYPEYIFFQSTAFHGEMIRREYPALFQKIRRLSDEGRYEFNGGAYVECDCNLVSGESLIRQFLYGQQWAQEYLNKKCDVFWLPDTFGYSAAIPQILKECGIRNFLTTKLYWNDTNPVPHDSFYWQGIDGSRVLCHFHDIGTTPDVRGIRGQVYGNPTPYRVGAGGISDKRRSRVKLVPYGLGDGGGGSSYDMLEMARRTADLEGCPRSAHMRVSDFMKLLETTSRNLPVYAGELYFEAHRGTLTSQSELKKMNRRLETAMHDLELLECLSIPGRAALPDTDEMYRRMLVNQFHDIIPGTSLGKVHDRALEENRRSLQRIGEYLQNPAPEENYPEALLNPLSWQRTSAVIPDEGKVPAGSRWQRYTDLEGRPMLALSGLRLPGLSVSPVEWENAGKEPAPSPFSFDGATLETPFLVLRLNENGELESVYSREFRRELCRTGQAPLNRFLLGEDVPKAWDNWDIDEDVWLKMRPGAALQKREIISDGAVQFRLRQTWKLGNASEIRQDLVVYAGDPRIDFETRVDWHEKHQLLKALFDLDVNASFARHEIQFGFAERPTYKKNGFEEAMFEVLNHKYTDISETNFGAAILNDSKYGISVDGTAAALTLLKGGLHPDTRGDEGVHTFTYSLLPHGAFSAQSVTRPAYELNHPILVTKAPGTGRPLAEVSAPNVIIETVKPACDGTGVILRLYEAEKTGCRIVLKVSVPFREAVETNMLEEEQGSLGAGPEIPLDFRAFEIKTIKLVR
mgnify:CR=1 FL=1